MRKYIAFSFIVSAISFVLASPLHSQSAISRQTASIDIQGGLEPYRCTQVATAEVGVIRNLFVKRGESISAGTSLVMLESQQQQVALREAEADYESTGQMLTIQRELTFNERRVDVTKALVSDGKGSPRELERYSLELEICRAKLSAMQEAKALAKIRTERASLDLENRTVRAPHDGIVEEIFKNEGEYIAGNSPVVLKLVDASKMRASFMLPEEIADGYRDAETAEIRLPTGVVVQGIVEFVAPVASIEGRTVAMTVILENPELKIRSAHCELVLP